MARSGSPMQWSRARTSTATRLAASVVAISLISLVAATIVGVQTGQRLADDLTDERLRATAESAAWDVGADVASLERTVEALASSIQASAAVEAFRTAFAELEADLDADAYDDEFDELLTVYRDEYLEPLREQGGDVQLRDVVGSSVAAGYLQYEYAIDLGALAMPATLDDANDATTWTDVHRRVHPVYRDVATRLDLVDLYLVDPSGDVLYSVNKRPDLGTNLRTGPFSGSVVANTFRQVIDDPDRAVAMSDLRFYNAAPGRVVGVVASPIVDGDVVGVLLLAYDASRFTDLVTADRAWEDAGLPETADVFMIGADGLLRTDPRGFLEARDDYLDAAVAQDRLDDDQRDQIEARGTSVLGSASVEETFTADGDVDESVRSTRSLSGVEVLSITVPVEGVARDWFIVTEVDESVADRGLGDFQELLIVGAAIFVVLLAFLAVAFANGIIRPVRYISDRLSRQGRDDRAIVVPPQTPVEIQQLAARLEVMTQTLAKQQEEISAARTERLGLLRSMLPPSVADRIAAGDLRSLDQVPAATVVVIVVLGLADLVRERDDVSGDELVDHLLTELDDVAAAHGCDRIKVVGDAYFAACGHDRPYIDHAPRSVAFALDALDVVNSIETDVPLGLAVGVHSGPVTTGTAGGASLVYDVWGLTVDDAHVLARIAAGGEIRVSGATRALLPDFYIVEPIDVAGAIADDAFLVVGAEERAPVS